MGLNNKQFEELHKALVEAYDVDRLEMMLRMHLGERLEDITLAESFEKVVFDVIKRAEAGGWTANLVKEAHEYMPGAKWLRSFYERYLLPPDISTPAPQKGYIYSLDLVPQARSCARSLSRVKQGLVGFAIPSETTAFLEYFRGRMQDRLRRGRVKVLGYTIRLNPLTTPVEFAVGTIAKQKRNLRENDVLVFVSTELQEQIEEFWLGLQREFGGELTRRLIVILAVRPGSIIKPQEIISLDEPRFQEDDVYRWVEEIFMLKNWPIEDASRWVEIIVKECQVGAELVVDLVYTHLEDALQELDRYETSEEFLQFLGYYPGTDYAQ
jgi:hypothetical protein